jgi:hypothetical protein
VGGHCMFCCCFLCYSKSQAIVRVSVQLLCLSVAWCTGSSLEYSKQTDKHFSPAEQEETRSRPPIPTALLAVLLIASAGLNFLVGGVWHCHTAFVAAAVVQQAIVSSCIAPIDAVPCSACWSRCCWKCLGVNLRESSYMWVQSPSQMV